MQCLKTPAIAPFVNKRAKKSEELVITFQRGHMSSFGLASQFSSPPETDQQPRIPLLRSVITYRNPQCFFLPDQHTNFLPRVIPV